MAKINGLYFNNKTYFDWDDAQYLIENELNCEFIKVNEITRIEENIDISFIITDTEKEDEVKEFLKKYCPTDNSFKTMCGQFDYDEVSIPKEIALNIFKEALSKYDSSIKPSEIEASYDSIGIVFDFEKPLLKSGIQAVYKDTILENLTSLISKVTSNIDQEFLKKCIDESKKEESFLDFIVEDTLKKYLAPNFSNWTINILDTEDTHCTVVSLCVL